MPDTMPPSDQLVYAQRCEATWELRTNGSYSTLRCRRCGVYVQAGGTPRCLASPAPATKPDCQPSDD
jgi:hypothetical protein